ncbi:hypothetical protein [Maridesulfovibrio bastinii]|uniref:hypothetical protein n=1 Tax=Maridesulfovibrio bastinii TaxID=47157 RepID=UPI0003F5582F|nr:hypothetical protein [Maridesulfovibrio bastinii]
MQKKYIGTGNYFEPNVQGKVVTMGNIQIDCAQRQSRETVIVDLCEDGQGNLVEGAVKGRAYIASLVIPAQIVTERPQVEGGESVLDDQDNQLYEQAIAPLDMTTVSITLWPYISTTNNSQEG